MCTDTRSLIDLGSELTSYDIRMILVEKDMQSQRITELHFT